MAYHALLWRVDLGGVSLQVRVLLVRGGKEECRILACRDAVMHHQRQVVSVIVLYEEGEESDSNMSIPTSG